MSPAHQELTRNVRLTTLLRPFLASFMIARPAVFPLWEANGFTFGEVLKLQIIFSLLILVFEVPSGWLGDKIGRRATLMVGVLSLIAGTVFYGCASTLQHFVVGEFLLGLGLAMVSGVDQALLFESLSGLNRSSEFMKRWGWQRTIDLLCSTGWSIVGGYLLVESVRLPFFVAAIGYTLCLPAALRLVEPASAVAASRPTTKKLFGDVVFVFERDRMAVWAFLFLAVVAATIGFFNTFSQGYLKVSNVPLHYYGWITGGLTLVAGLCSMLTHKVHRAVGLVPCVWLIVSITSVSLVGSGFSSGVWAWLWLVPLATQKGFAGIVLSQVLNNRLRDEVRVTVLSLASLAGRVCSIVLMLLVDKVGSDFGARSAFLVVGVVFACSAIPLAVWLARRARRWASRPQPGDARVPA